MRDSKWFSKVILLLAVLLVCDTTAQASYQEVLQNALQFLENFNESSIVELDSLAVPADFSLSKIFEEAQEGIDVLLQKNNLPTESSELCLNQTVYALQNIQGFGLKMIDAMGKLPSGIFAGDLNWWGDYNGCVSVTSGGKGNMDYSGKYCKLGAGVTLQSFPAVLSVGLCVPSGCHAEDIQGVIASAPVVLSSILRLNLTALDKVTINCHEPIALDIKAIATIIVCAVSIALLLIGTLYEVYTSTITDNSGDDSIELKKRSVNHVQSNGTSAGELIFANGEIKHDLFGKDAEHMEVTYDKANGEAPKVSNGNVEATPYMLEEKKPDYGIFRKILLAFSVINNTTKLMSTGQPKGALTCVHGIRVFSILWVILGHTFGFANGGLKNALWVSQLMKRPSFGAIQNATVSVDSFFVMSGLLVTYLTLRELEKRKGKLGVKGWIMIYVHRYIRLTPVYMLLLLVWSCLIWYVGEGPIWPNYGTIGTIDPNCHTYWWTNLLYINNFWGMENQCFAWAWYLANDMQFFIIAIPLIFLLYRFPKVGGAATLLLTVGSIVAAMVVIGIKDFPLAFFTMALPDYMEMYYIKPWCRFQTYGIGMLAGYFLYQSKCKLNLKWTTNLVMWALAAVLCLLPLYGPYEIESSNMPSTTAASVAYYGMARSSWGVGLAGVIVLCCTGHGGYINQFLSWKAFVPVGRLTYCVYLTNVIVIDYYMLTVKEPITYSNFFITMIFFAMMVFNYAAGFVASVLWEAPTMAIEKIIFKR